MFQDPIADRLLTASVRPLEHFDAEFLRQSRIFRPRKLLDEPSLDSEYRIQRDVSLS